MTDEYTPIDKLADGAFDDVMVDIETMSLHPTNALILSIGMVEFNPREQDLLIGNKVLLFPSIPEQLLLGRVVDVGTQEFWSAQTLEASDHWMNHKASPEDRLSVVCSEMTTFLIGKKRIWANGIMFDLSNLAGLYAQVFSDRKFAPWHYRAPRDMRTFCEETPTTRKLLDGEVAELKQLVAHHPVDDCIRQAFSVFEHWPR